MNLPHPQARRFILAAQGLTAARGGASLVETIEKTGWVRTLGGVDVYLAARARSPMPSGRRWKSTPPTSPLSSKTRWATGGRSPSIRKRICGAAARGFESWSL